MIEKLLILPPQHDEAEAIEWVEAKTPIGLKGKKRET